MSKHLTPQEAELIHRLAGAQLTEVDTEDGPRNAAAFATVEATARRFHEAPHAPETTLRPVLESLAQLTKAYRVADAYRAVVAGTMTQLHAEPYTPTAVESGHNAIAQWAAATRQLADVLAATQVDLYEHLRAVHEGGRP